MGRGSLSVLLGLLVFLALVSVIIWTVSVAAWAPFESKNYGTRYGRILDFQVIQCCSAGTCEDLFGIYWSVIYIDPPTTTGSTTTEVNITAATTTSVETTAIPTQLPENTTSPDTGGFVAVLEPYIGVGNAAWVFDWTSRYHKDYEGEVYGPSEDKLSSFDAQNFPSQGDCSPGNFENPNGGPIFLNVGEAKNVRNVWLGLWISFFIVFIISIVGIIVGCVKFSKMEDQEEDD